MSTTSETETTRYEPLQPRHLSHDLRGPLNSILGFAELLLDGIEGPLNDIQLEDIAAMRKSAQSLLELINVMVDLSKSEVSSLNYLLGPVDLKKLATDVAASADLHGFPVELDLPDSLPSAEADINRVTQMLRYPLLFAKTKKAAGVTVWAGATETEVNVRMTASNLILPESELAELFEATASIDESGRSKLTTGGLFMPLAARLATLQKGYMKAYNSPGAGLTVEFALPVFNPNALQ
jgi:K+-sensing histidine kinase KdpD